MSSRRCDRYAHRPLGRWSWFHSSSCRPCQHSPASRTSQFHSPSTSRSPSWSLRTSPGLQYRTKRNECHSVSRSVEKSKDWNFAVYRPCVNIKRNLFCLSGIWFLMHQQEKKSGCYWRRHTAVTELLFQLLPRKIIGQLQQRYWHFNLYIHLLNWKICQLKNTTVK